MLAVTPPSPYHPPPSETIGPTMLQQLRVASKSWVASVIIGILVLAFALWGVADIFRGGIDTVVAEVGSQTISSVQYDLQLKQQLRTLSQQTQTELTLEQAREFGLDRNVLDQAISRAALDDQGSRLGLTASVDTIRNEIRASNAFRGPDGAFDPLAFQRALQDAGMSEQGFVESTKADIARSQLIGATSEGILPPPGLARLLYDYVNEQRTIEYLVVTPEEAGQPAQPSQTDLEAYYKAHPDLFSAPEYRAFDFVDIGPEQVAADIKVTDDEVKAEYDAHRATYEKPEQRDVEQIVFPSKAEADAAAMRVKTSAEFTALARERKLSDADLKLGTFGAAGMDPRLSQAVFAVPEGGVTAPVQGPFGWVILRAAKVVPGENKTLEEVAETIREALVLARSEGRMTELANMFEDARGSGGSLADAAMKTGLMLHRVPAADRTGNTPEGAKADIPADPNFMATVYLTETGDDTDINRGPDGRYYALQVTGITPPAAKPLESVREEVREKFLAEARTKLLDAKVKEFVEAAKKDGSLAGVGRTLGHAPVKSMPLRRGQTDDVFSANVMAQIFGQPRASVITGPAGKGTGIVIARVTDVTHPEPDVSAAAYADFRRSASQQLAATAVDTLAAASRQRAGVSIHEATVKQVTGETAAQ